MLGARQSSAFRPAGAQAAYSSTAQPGPGTLTIDALTITSEQATPEQIGLYLIPTRTVAAGSVSVRYRAVGSGTWLPTSPNGGPIQLLRISTTGNEAGGPTTIIDSFAGSIFDLQPGTQYDVELTHVESGQADKVTVVQRTTRALPAAAAVTGTGTARTANSVATIGTTFGQVNPGDVLTIADGTYDVSGLTLSRSGTAANPIYIRGTTRAGTILRDTSGNVLTIAAGNIVFENLTIQGSGVDTGNTSPVSYGIEVTGARSNITVRQVNILGVDKAFTNDASNQTGTLIYNCTIQGNDAWIVGNLGGTSPTGNDTGVEIPGFGNCVWNCTITGFGDATAFAGNEGAGVRAEGSHFYRNRISNSCDDTIEFDYGTRNLGFYDNLVTNCGTALSVSPAYAGPFYAFRNVFVNTIRGPYKINGQGIGSTGFLIYNNTIVRTDGSTGGWGMTQTGTNGEWNNYSFRNNLLVYRGSATGGLAALEQPGNDPCDFDYNAWFPNSGIWWTNSGGSWGNLAAAKTGLASATRTPLFGSSQRMAHDVITVTNPFTNAITLGASHTTEITGTPDATLSASGPKNLGVSIPGITDGFTGAAPDIGAIITGRTAVTYGDVSASQPAWMSGMGLFTWKQLTNTRPSAAGATDNMTAFSGCVVDPVRRNLIPWGGGHNDSPDNAVYAIRYGRDVPDVVVLNPKSSSTPDNVAHNPDGKPSARHNYDLLVYRAIADEFFSVSCPSPWHAGSGDPYPDCDGFKLTTNTWYSAGTYASIPTGLIGTDFDRSACGDDAGNVYATINNSHDLMKWTAASNTWSSLWGGGNDIFGGALVFDPVRQRLVLFASSANGGAWWTMAGVRTGLSLSANAQNKTVLYCPDRVPGGSFFLMRNNGAGSAPSLFEIDPTTYAPTQITLSGTAPAPTDGTTFYTRFQIDTNLGICLLLPGDQQKDAWAFRYK